MAPVPADRTQHTRRVGWRRRGSCEIRRTFQERDTLDDIDRRRIYADFTHSQILQSMLRGFCGRGWPCVHSWWTFFWSRQAMFQESQDFACQRSSGVHVLCDCHPHHRHPLVWVPHSLSAALAVSLIRRQIDPAAPQARPDAALYAWQ